MSAIDRGCLIFLHVPKSAGQTLASIIRRRYDGSRIIQFNTLDRPLSDLATIPLEDRRKAEVLMGHLHYGVHRYIPQETSYVTLMREPVARVISLYRYILKDPRHSLHERVKTSGMRLEEFVESGIYKSRVENGQTRLFCGIQGGDPGLQELEQAKANLSQFAMVGLTERFDESLLLISDALGWRIPLYVSRNVFPNSPEVSVESRSRVTISDFAEELIRERNALDLGLYDLASSLLAERLERGGTSFQKKVARFQKLNRLPDTVGAGAWRIVRRFRDAAFRRRRGEAAKSKSGKT